MPFIILAAILLLLWENAPWVYVLIFVGLTIYWYCCYIARTKRVRETALDKQCQDELRNNLTPSRRELLKEFFGLSYEECTFVKFDGLHFQHRCAVPHDAYTLVALSHAEMVVVKDRSLPHSVGWTYERVNGGPDRRFNDNKEILRSNRYKLSFSGKEDFSFFFYTQPHSLIDRTFVERMNDFLLISQLFDYDKIILGIDAAAASLSEIHQRFNAELTVQRECTSIIKAIVELKKLSADTESMEAKLMAAQERIGISKAGIEILQSEKSTHTRELERLKLSMGNAIHEIRLKKKIEQLSMSANTTIGLIGPR